MEKHEDIDINKLSMDTQNSRHQSVKSQREIISWMTSPGQKMGEKLLALARDVVKFGLNPSEQVSVIESEEDDEEYVVLEGNRRVTAIKLLNNPDTAPNEEWKAKFRKVRGEDYKLIKRVPCVIYTDMDRAFHFMELKHLNEAGGAGTVPWDTRQKTRHEQRAKGKSRQLKSLQLLDYIQDHGSIDQEVKDLAGGDFPLTTLDRLLSAVDFRKFLGLDIDKDGNLQFIISPEESLKPIVKVIQDFGTRKKNVRDVINKEKRDEYIATFKKASLPDYTRTLESPIGTESAATNGTSATKASPGIRSPRFQDPSNRTSIVLAGTTIPIDPRHYNRAKRIFEEMRKLSIRDKAGKPIYPNAGILLLRLFHEISMNTYLEKHDLRHTAPTGWKDISLSEKTNAVLKDVQAKGLLKPLEAKVVIKALGDGNKVSNPNSLNDFAHNAHQVPNPNDLIDIWDTYSKFYAVAWSTLN